MRWSPNQQNDTADTSVHQRHTRADHPFTVRATDDKDMKESRRVRIFHGFGPDTIRWKGELYKVQREQAIQPK